MVQQQLSDRVKRIIASAEDLSFEDLQATIGQFSKILADQVQGGVNTTTSEQLNRASSAIIEGLEAACDHGFKPVTAPDGKPAIEVKITRADGKEETRLLSTGARGKWHHELEAYGEQELAGATLLSHADFKAVVERLFVAIEGRKVVDGVLQMPDKVLKEAFRILKEGVRHKGGFSWAVFGSDEGGAVVNWNVEGASIAWYGYVTPDTLVLFGASPAESIK